jgi:uncharacterized protein
MNILIDIGHPAHVHLFRNFIHEMRNSQHQIFVITKNVNSVIILLKKFKIPFYNIGEKKDSVILKYLYQIIFIIRTAIHTKRNKIDISMGISMTLPITAKLTNVPNIGLDDDDIEATPTFAKYINKSQCILTPECLAFEHRGPHHICYSGFHELAYLHPNRFKPDINVLYDCGLAMGEVFFILRFNTFKAHHDKNIAGLSIENKTDLIEILERKGRVIISTERDIEKEFVKYKVPISPERIHSLLNFATIFIGDSQTMTSEAAVLGTPAIRCNSFVGRISYLEEEEHKYGLTFGFRPDNFSSLLEKVEELLTLPDLKAEWQHRRQCMLADKIDVTAFMVWFIENYPESACIMKENPDYQYNFK